MFQNVYAVSTSVTDTVLAVMSYFLNDCLEEKDPRNDGLDISSNCSFKKPFISSGPHSELLLAEQISEPLGKHRTREGKARMGGDIRSEGRCLKHTHTHFIYMYIYIYIYTHTRARTIFFHRRKFCVLQLWKDHPRPQRSQILQ